MLECLVCQEEYNYTDNLPKILPDCGHTVCSACLSKLLVQRKCPECRKGFSAQTPIHVKYFQTNVALQRVLETMANFCKVHQSPLTQLCMTDKIKVCINCVQHESHDGHVIKSIESVKAEAIKKAQEYYKVEREIEENARLEQEFLTSCQSNLLKIIQDADSFQGEIDAKMEQYLWDIESLFVKQKSEHQSKIAHIISYNEKVLNLKKILEQGEITPEFLQALEETIDYPSIDEAHKITIQNSTQELEQKISSAFSQMTELSASFARNSSLCDASLLDPDCKWMELLVRIDVVKRTCFAINIFGSNGVSRLLICPKGSSKYPQSTKPLFVLREDLEKVETITIKHDRVKFTDEMIDALHYIWKSLPSPVSVQLEFDPRSFIEESVMACKDYPFWNSENLSINLAHCQIKNEENFVKSLETLIKEVGDFKNLDFILQGSNLSDASMESLVKAISASMDPQKLTLSLSKTRIANQSMQTLFPIEGSESLKKVKEFSLDISQTSIVEQGLDSLFQGLLQNLANCEKLSLDLAGLPVKAKHIELLTQQYFKAASQLSQFRLSLANTRLDRQGLEKICFELPHNLTTLGLNFTNTRISDGSVQFLAFVSLAAMTNLAALDLNFSETEVGDSSIIALCDVFTNSTNLKVLKLNFENTDISKKTLLSILTDVVPMISPLVKFNIKVNKTQTNQAINNLIDEINKKYE